jgi:hypothetical protein
VATFDEVAGKESRYVAKLVSRNLNDGDARAAR